MDTYAAVDSSFFFCLEPVGFLWPCRCDSQSHESETYLGKRHSTVSWAFLSHPCTVAYVLSLPPTTQVFGAYISHELRLSDRTFYGNGDCFVFNIVPNGRVYPWTGENEYFIKCETAMFHIGAGEYVIHDPLGTRTHAPHMKHVQRRASSLCLLCFRHVFRAHNPAIP